MKIAIYARVSSDDQKTDLQLDAIRSYSENRELSVFKEYVDRISGAKADRPALNELLADARRKRFDVVVVWKIDRLGRSVPHLLSVLTELQALGIGFVSLQEALDTKTPAGRMVFTFLEAVAEFERAIIAERVKAGMSAAKKRGKHCGRPQMCINEIEIQSMKEQGMSLRKIAKSLGVSHQTIANQLKAV